ncbi:ATP-grasp domain-containing protein [Peribacillus sp. SCS-155]|uniref:ATP-grasp domain-containing protein n=1 Tax=Peribacillus sedimenti TaxID=3115297 RepID=UPI0039064B4E
MGETSYQMNQANEPHVLRPSKSIKEIYGDNIVYNPKLYATDYGHFSGDLLTLESLTGRELTVVGDVPVVCHASTTTDPAIALLQKAGLHIPQYYTYENDKEYVEVLNKVHKQDKKMISQFPQPTDEVSHDLFWIDPKLHAYLCDKQNIPELVPAEHVARRRLMSLDEILQEKPKLPFVLKTGDGRTTAGGYGVVLVENEDQLNSIDETFGDLSHIILEDYIEYDENISVHYVADKDGEINFIGKSVQIVNDGSFRGSWITTEIEDRYGDIVQTGYEVMNNITKMGYVGVAGFDVLIKDGQYYFIDLNIRFNASTCGLLLYKDIKNRFGKDTVRLCNFDWTDDFDDLIPVAEKYLDKEQFVPLSLLDADYFPDQKRVSKMIGLVIGDSVEEVENILEDMAQDDLIVKE